MSGKFWLQKQIFTRKLEKGNGEWGNVQSLYAHLGFSSYSADISSNVKMVSWIMERGWRQTSCHHLIQCLFIIFWRLQNILLFVPQPHNSLRSWKCGKWFFRHKESFIYYTLKKHIWFFDNSPPPPPPHPVYLLYAYEKGKKVGDPLRS